MYFANAMFTTANGKPVQPHGFKYRRYTGHNVRNRRQDEGARALTWWGLLLVPPLSGI